MRERARAPENAPACRTAARSADVVKQYMYICQRQIHVSGFMYLFVIAQKGRDVDFPIWDENVSDALVRTHLLKHCGHYA